MELTQLRALYTKREININEMKAYHIVDVRYRDQENKHNNMVIFSYASSNTAI